MSGIDARNDQAILDALAVEDAWDQLAASHGMTREEFALAWNGGVRRVRERAAGKVNDRTETGPGAYGTLVADHYGAYRQKGRG